MLELILLDYLSSLGSLEISNDMSSDWELSLFLDSTKFLSCY